MHVDKQRHRKEICRTAGAEPAIAKLSMDQSGMTFPLRSTDSAVVQKLLRELLRVEKAIGAAPMKQVGVVESRNQRETSLDASSLRIIRTRLDGISQGGQTNPIDGWKTLRRFEARTAGAKATS